MFACLATFLSFSSSIGADSTVPSGGFSSSDVDHDGVGDIAGWSPPRDLHPAMSDAWPRYPRRTTAVDARASMTRAADPNRPLTDAVALAATRDRRRIVALDMSRSVVCGSPGY